MRTIITICALIFVTATQAQITVNEKALKKRTLKDDDVKNEIKFKLNLNNYTKENLEKIKTKLEELKINTENEEAIIISEEEKTNLEKIDAQIDQNVTIDEESIKKNPFYYDYFVNRLSNSKRNLNNLLSEKRESSGDIKTLTKLDGKIKAAEKEKDNYKKIVDDLNDSIDKDNDTEDGKRWLPSSKKVNREDFFELLYSKDSNKTSYIFNNVAAQIGSNSASISSELIASYIKFVRLSFGTSISNADKKNTTAKADDMPSTDQTDAFQRLLSSGGGNIYLNLELPLFYNQSGISMVYFNFNSKFGMVLDQFSDDVDTSSGNINNGLNFYGSLSTDDKKSFIFFVNANFGSYSGGDDFYKKLNLSENKIFAFGQATVGVDIAKSIRVSYTVGTVGSDESLRSRRGVVGIQLLKEIFGSK